MKKIIQTPNAPVAIGPYSQAVTYGELIFCSGQIALNPQSGQMLGQTAAEQTQQVILNLKAILEAAGSKLEKVLKCTVFLRSMDDFESVNEVYNRHFAQSCPARACVEVSRLPKGALVEIECVAYL